MERAMAAADVAAMVVVHLDGQMLLMGANVQAMDFVHP